MKKEKEMKVKQTAVDLGKSIKIPMEEVMADRSLNQPIKAENDTKPC